MSESTDPSQQGFPDSPRADQSGTVPPSPGEQPWPAGDQPPGDAAQPAAQYPGQPQPGQSYPGQPQPGQSYPGQSYPGQPQPGQSYPGQPQPGQSYPGQQYPGQPYASQPYASQPYPAYAYPPPAPPTSANAIVGLVLSIVSWVICPVIPAIVALVLANKAEKEIEAAPDRVSGRGLILPTRIISWINIGLFAAVIVIGGVFVLIAAVLSAA